MAESQISIDGHVRPLHELFFVIATQNPIEFHGTYPLPEAQMDRFSMLFNLGYVDAAQEIAILSEQNKSHPLEAISACVSAADVIRLRRGVSDIRVSEEIKHYIVSIIRASRNIAGIANGASPRAALALMKIAQAFALFEGMEFVTPEHIQAIAIPVIAHRLMLDSQAKFSGLSTAELVQDILKKLPVPI